MEECLKPCDKLPTGIEGFEHLSIGGIPLGRTTLVVGTSGTGKTLFALESIWRGVTEFNRSGVFVTFAERESDVLRNVLRLGWRLDQAIEDDRFRIVDASPQAYGADEIGSFDLSGLMYQILDAVQEIDAKLVVLDSVGSLFAQYSSDFVIRQELYRIVNALREEGLTSIITAERLHEYGLISRYGVEEFVSDNVIILRNVLEDEKRRRTIDILKFRGDTHLKGEYPFTITEEGLSMLPLAAMELNQESSSVRLSSGDETLDKMCGGGFFRDSIVLISGATGTGKTLLSTTFAAAGCSRGERVLVLAYEESRPQLLRNARGWGMDYRKWEEAGLLKLDSVYPESAGLEDHMVRIRRVVRQFKPKRLVIDSISALERVGGANVFREFVIGLTSFIKEQNCCGFLTCTTPTLAGGESITETHISTLTDAILLLRYVEIGSSLHRGLAVIKMRGSRHEKQVNEYYIDGEGIHLTQPFNGVYNVVLGHPTAILEPDGNELDASLRDSD